ncbi:MAG TPA: M1 family metallopeptidase, partial [Gammaproteobacteria bacterium]|nr:M1 family metallopeptidase [Gammaproteobacteria bacterium]
MITIRIRGLRAAALLLCAALGVPAGSAGADDRTAAGSSPAPHAAVPTARFDPAQTFAPLTLPQPVNSYRSADGTPGPDYWQNRADYELHARLDPDAKTLTADEIITYTNNSPTALAALWLQLDQNIYRSDARARFSSVRPRTQFTEGYVLDAIAVSRGGQSSPANYLVDDTRMQIRLVEPVAAHGGRVQLHLRYHYLIPGRFGGRTAWTETPQGEIYDIAQWYPRLAVYDDLHGWDTLPYLGSEFYLEYGNFDYYITVPSDMLVAGSGTLENPDEVLTAAERERLARARNSDETVMIRGADEVGDPQSRPVTHGTLTWHFRMEDTRDVAFSASRAFVWDAAAIRLPGNRRALAMSFYPPESGGKDAWGRSTEYVQQAVEQYSKRWFPFPYPAAINVAGPASGMEYPGIVFDGMSAKGKGLFWITAHEIGHTWFPMLVGTDERRNAWMDEGLNTFIDVYESQDFEHGVYGPKHDQEYAPGGGNPVDEIVPLLEDPKAPVIMSRADAIPGKYSHPVSYFKAALGLVLLREQILGPERFDWAFKKFISDWAYKHPSPSDFFRAMDSAAGEDLGWFWRGWFMHNWTLDLAAEKVTYVGGDPSKGAEVTLANLDPLVMPCVVQVDFADGTRSRLRVPADAWIQKTQLTLNL